MKIKSDNLTQITLSDLGLAAVHFVDDEQARAFYDEFRIHPFVRYTDSDETFYLTKDPGNAELAGDLSLYRGVVYLPKHAPNDIELDGDLDVVAPLPAELLLEFKPEFPECVVTVVHADDGIRLTKAFNEVDGCLVKNSAPNLSHGSAISVRLPLDQILSAADGSSECLVLGAIRDVAVGDVRELTTAFIRTGNAISRTREYFHFPERDPAFAFIDHDPDPDTFPPIEPLSLDDLTFTIQRAWPNCGLDGAAMIYRPSSSAGVRLVSDEPGCLEEAYRGSGHICLAFAPGTDPTAWMRTAYAKLIETGQSHAYITKAGSIDVRTVIDRSVAQPCRVQYTGAPVLGVGVVRDELRREEDQWERPGGCVSVRGDDLYSDETVKRIVTDARRVLATDPAVKAKIQEIIEFRRTEHYQRSLEDGIEEEEAVARARDYAHRLGAGGDVITLLATDPIELYLDDGSVVSLADLWSDYQAGKRSYADKDCADPYDEQQRRRKARIYYNETELRLFSFLHGGTAYKVKDADPEESELEAKFRELAKLSKVDYELRRKDEARLLGIRVSVLDKEVQRCKMRGATGSSYVDIEPWVAELNESYAVVNAHGKTFVMSQYYDSQFRRSIPEYQTCRAFEDLYASDYVIGTDAEGNPAEVSKGSWVKAKGRRTYHRMVFQPTKPPDEYWEGEMCVKNQWTGLGSGLPELAEGGSAEPMLRHIRERLADDDATHATYILRWLAYKIQNPSHRNEVALVLRGQKGAGKGIVGRLMARIFGRHALHIASADMLTGSFNGHLADICFLLADEAFFPGDKANLGRLNVLVTDEYFMLHPKGMMAYQAFNMLSILMLSNEHWVVPATEDERRYAVFDVRPKAQDGADDEYFRELNYWCDEANNPLAGVNIRAFIEHMQGMDLGGWHPRSDIPQTEALAAQREHTLEPAEQFWLNALREGEFSPRHGWCPLMKMDYIYALFEIYCRKHSVGQYQRLTKRQFSQRVVGRLGLQRRRTRHGEEYFDSVIPINGILHRKKSRYGYEDPVDEAVVAFKAELKASIEMLTYGEASTVQHPQNYVYSVGTLEEARHAFVKAFRVSPQSVGLDLDWDDQGEAGEERIAA